jgi:GGDEF domain-containing protein
MEIRLRADEYLTPGAGPAGPGWERQMNASIETQLTSRMAAAVWAAIAFAGAIATIGPLQIPGSDISEMRFVAASAAMFGGVTFVLPWARLPRIAFGLMLVLMSAHIAALAYASGAAHSELTILFTFVVALAASFMPVRASVAQLCVIAIMLTVLLLIVGRADTTRLEVIRVTMLLSTLVVLCGLVLVMRALLAQDQLGLRVKGSFRYGAGLLNEEQLGAAVEAELSRAARHGRPLSLVMVEVTGELAHQLEPGQQQRLVTAIARGVLGRIRVEDSAAHLGGLRFGVMTPETNAPGAAAVAGTVADMVRRRLISAGYDGGSFEVAVGWADFPGAAATAEELVAATKASLERGDRGLAGGVPAPQATPHPAPGH